MNRDNVSKEELLAELQGLQLRYNSLKALYDADAVRWKQTEEAIVKGEQNYRTVFNAVTESIFIHDADTGKIIDVNDAMLRTFGYGSKEEVLHGNIGDLSANVKPYDQEAARNNIRKAIDEGPQTFNWISKRKDGSFFWMELKLTKIAIGGEGRVLAVGRDITERKEAEENMLKSARVYAFISQINQIIVRIRDKDKLFEEACNTAIDQGKFQMAWIGLVDEETKLVQRVTSAGVEDGYLSKIKKISVSDQPEGRGPTGTAIREGKHYVCNDIANDPRMVPWKDEALKRGYRSSIALPIIFFGRVIGAFSLYAPIPCFFDQKEIMLLDEVTNDISFALESIETERKQRDAEHLLRESEQRLSSIYSTVDDVLFYLDVEGDGKYRFISVNQAFCRVTGLTREQVLGKMVHDVIPETSLSFVLEKYKQAIESNTIVQWEETSDYPNGQLTGEVKIAPVVDVQGHCTHLVGTVHDITERKQAELLIQRKNAEIEAQNKVYQQMNEELKLRNQELITAQQKAMESEAQTRSVLQTAMDGFLEIDFNAKIIEANEVACKMLGYSHDEMLALCVRDFELIDTPVEIDKRIKKIIETGEDRFESKYLCKNGQVIDVELSVKIHASQDLIVTFMRDITTRKQAENDLIKAKQRAEESEETYRMLFESINDAVFISEMDNNNQLGKFIQVNDVACKRLGYTRDELLTKNIFDINSDKSRRNVPAILQDILKKKYAIVEVEHLTKDGRVIPVEINTNVTQFKNKTIFFSIARDITERRQSEKLLRESEEKYRNLFNSVHVGIFLTKLDGSAILDFNEHYLKIFEYSREEMMNNPSINYWVDPLERAELIRQLKRNGRVIDYECRMLTKYGRIKNCLTSVRLYEEEGILEGSIIDITERKNIEIELVNAKEKAEESDRLKTAFLQNMSHEIRTPMNAIMGFSSLLVENHSDKAKLEKFSKIINQRCTDLLDIINDILDIAKIESGQLSVNVEECTLSELFAELFSFFTEYQGRIGKQHINFSLQAMCDPSENIIVTDKVKLKQIFINLISNAFKFTNDGTIEGGCKFDENHRLVFYVSDTGIGIPSDKKDAVFERFTQLNQGAGKIFGGTGLGLSIVKGLVGLLGGEIFLESEPGKGSTFSFTIPYQTSRQQHRDSFEVVQPANIWLSDKTILVVEDDLFNAEYLKEILSGIGLNILEAQNGRQGVDISVNQPVDLVLMDIRLPDIDGYEATRQIRQQKPTLKIIAQTAYASHDESQKAIDAGCNDYISKPTQKGLLLSVVYKHLAKQKLLLKAD